jgi:transposase
MEPITPPHDWKDYRRLRAWDLAQQDWKQCEIARALGVTEGAVSQWLKRARAEGTEALRHHPAPGAQPKLTDEQRAQLPTLLDRGAEAYGFRGDVWTTTRVASLIERTFGVRYHPAHVSRLLRVLNWSPQQPIERASQRNEEAIQRWYEERWPALKKGQRRTDRPSSGSTNPASTCCQVGSGPMLHEARLPSCRCP